MLNYKEDLRNTDLILKWKNAPGYEKLYFSSNERLKDIFYNIDLTGKKVLSVLGSGDQAFYIYNLNAKEVDLFDKNKLTIYYFYLRIWLIEYCDNFYFPTNVDNSFLINLLKKVKPKTEEEAIAYNYWKEFIKIAFNNKVEFNDLQEEEPSNENEIKNLDKIKENLKMRNFKFYNIDIASNNLTLKKKYDVIYASNIIDWLCFVDTLIKNFENNLYSILEKDGIVIFSDLTETGPVSLEMEIFKSNFNYQSLPITIRNQDDRPGYCYKKKRIK